MSLQRVRKDLQRFLNSGGFQVDLTFESPSAFTATIKGIGMKRTLVIETEDQVALARVSHATFFEQDLIDTGYPVRDLEYKVALAGHHVSFEDSTGNTVKYEIDRVLPDETTGSIGLIFSNYAES